MTRRAAAILTRVATDTCESVLTDRELLGRFTDGDEAAFAALVSRHARMVLGVCRRLLPTTEDAEDACQATFLILARKARGVRWQASAANWLHTTARLVAAKARRATARRVKRECRAAMPEAVAATNAITGSELLVLLDEELGKLPALYRDPLVLCYLEGLSREEAAARLGVPQATVKTRLERGRRRLEVALVRRGAGIGLGLLALAVTTPATCAGQIDRILAAVSGSPSATVAVLSQGVGMNTAVRLIVMAMVAAVAAAGLRLGLYAVGPAAEPSAPGSARTAVPARASVPKAADEKFDKAVATARQKATDYLKMQQKDGNWEKVITGGVSDMGGGITAMAALGLLEAGVPADDAAVTRAVEYLVKVESKKTYVVSLQTQVLARVDARKHKEKIQKNVDWLLNEAVNSRGKLAGWSYPGNQQIGDGSNTHFAVMGLHAAALADAKVDAKVWDQVRDMYARARQEGGWSYYGDERVKGQPSRTMTIAALVGLVVAAEFDTAGRGPDPAFEKGMAAFLKVSPRPGTSVAYEWLVTAELGNALASHEFKAGDKVLAWYREGAEKLLKEQKGDGSWMPGPGVDSNPIYATACGLYFLGPPKKP